MADIVSGTSGSLSKMTPKGTTTAFGYQAPWQIHVNLERQEKKAMSLNSMAVTVLFFSFPLCKFNEKNQQLYMDSTLSIIKIRM